MVANSVTTKDSLKTCYHPTSPAVHLFFSTRRVFHLPASDGRHLKLFPQKFLSLDVSSASKKLFYHRGIYVFLFCCSVFTSTVVNISPQGTSVLVWASIFVCVCEVTFCMRKKIKVSWHHLHHV